MIIGLILAGSLLGAGAMLSALVLGYPIWIALLLYPAVGMLGVLAAGVILALRPGRADRSAPADLRPTARAEWG